MLTQPVRTHIPGHGFVTVLTSTSDCKMGANESASISNDNKKTPTPPSSPSSSSLSTFKRPPSPLRRSNSTPNTPTQPVTEKGDNRHHYRKDTMPLLELVCAKNTLQMELRSGHGNDQTRQRVRTVSAHLARHANGSGGHLCEIDRIQTGVVYIVEDGTFVPRSRGGGNGDSEKAKNHLVTARDDLSDTMLELILETKLPVHQRQRMEVLRRQVMQRQWSDICAI